MVRHQGIEVYLAPFTNISGRFSEHPVSATSPSEAYIEAVDGEPFVIVVDLGEEYEAKGSARLWTECFLDGEFMSKQVSPYVTLRDAVPPGSDLKGRYTNSRAEVHIDGRRVKCGYAFSPVLMDENLVMSDNEVHRAVATYGTVVVKIWRCVNVGSGRPLTTIINNFPCDVVRDSRVSAKAVVEDNHVSHAVQHLMMGPPFRLGPRTETAHQREVVKMGGAEGQCMTFTIRGRSRAALQGLGIIAEDITIRETPVKQEAPEREATLGVMKVENDVIEIVDSEDEVEPVPRRIKVEEQDATQTPAATDSATPLRADERTKKRKALEDELEQVEDEERLLELRQRKRRLRRDLALLEGDE